MRAERLVVHFVLNRNQKFASYMCIAPKWSLVTDIQYARILLLF